MFILATSLLLTLSAIACVAASGSDDHSPPSNDAGNSCCNDSVTTCCALNLSATLSLIFVVVVVTLLLCWCGLRLCGSSLSRYYHRRFGASGKPRRQITTWLHATDRPLASLPDHRCTRQLTQFKGFYSVGKNGHTHPFTMALRFNFTSSPRSIEGFGIDSQPFTIESGIFTISESEVRCQIVERFETGQVYVMYGECRSCETFQFRGNWSSDDGGQQGEFELQPDDTHLQAIVDSHHLHRDATTANDDANNAAINVDDTVDDASTVASVSWARSGEIELSVLH